MAASLVLNCEKVTFKSRRAGLGVEESWTDIIKWAVTSARTKQRGKIIAELISQ